MSDRDAKIGRIAGTFVVVSALVACGRHDDGKITAEPDRTVRTGMPVLFVPGAPAEAPPEPGSPPTNPLAMPLKHDGPAVAGGAVAAAPLDPCAPKDPKGPLAMRLRHDGPGDKGARNPLCMRLK
jgi:hypothetical protein